MYVQKVRKRQKNHKNYFDDNSDAKKLTRTESLQE